MKIFGKRVTFVTVILLLAVGVFLINWGRDVMRSANSSSSSVVEILNDGNYQQIDFIATEDISTINVTETSGDIEIFTADVDHVKVEYYESDNIKFHIYEADGYLTVDKEQKGSSFLSNIEEKVKITVPSDTVPEVYAKATSGSISVTNISAPIIMVENTSGALNVVDSFSSGSIYATNTSGNINLASLAADGDVTASNTSGTIHMENVACNSILTESTSGSSTLTNVDSASGIYCMATSGSIKFERIKSEGNISMEASSGSVKGSVVGKEKDYIIATSTTSGSCNLKEKYEGSKYLSISTTSGSINVEFVD